jgi:hypothetical protein
VLAAEGGAHERRGLVRRESQENLLDKIFEQCWWRCRLRVCTADEDPRRRGRVMDACMVSA